MKNYKNITMVVTTRPPVTASPLDERRGADEERLEAYFPYVGGKRRGRQQSLSPRGEQLTMVNVHRKHLWISTLMILLTFCIFTGQKPHAAGSKKHKTKYLSLYIGVFHDEKVPLISRSVKASGTFRPITNVGINKRDKSLRFEPKKEGVATFILQNPDTGNILYEYRLDVKKTNLSKVTREIRSLLGDIDGIQIKVLNNRVVVDGEILIPRDMIRIHSVVKQYDDLASSLVVLSTIAERKIAQFMERDINNPEIQVRVINKKFILEGLANSKEEKDKAEIIAKAYINDIIIDEAVADQKVKVMDSQFVINLIKVKPAPAEDPKKMVQLIFHYVELNKNYTKGFRFQWTPDLGDGSQISFTTGGRSPSGLITTLTGTISNLLPKLNWAKEHGHARVLKSTSIIVQDGMEGVLNSISRIPYQVVSGQGIPSTAFEEAGLKTSITPKINGSHITMSTTFSSKALVDYTAQGPLTSSKDFKTTIMVRSGHSAAVAGLITNESGTGYNRLPKNVSSNPLISLYASKDFRRSQSQFVVFITPIIKSSASSGAEKIKRRFRIRN